MGTAAVAFPSVEQHGHRHVAFGGAPRFAASIGHPASPFAQSGPSIGSPIGSPIGSSPRPGSMTASGFLMGGVRRPPANDMKSLAAALYACRDGTGEIREILTSATFSPRLPGLTKMVAKLSRENAYRKGLEVYDALPAIGLMADTAITNAAISACDKGGQWQRAMEVFGSMEASGLRRDAITYSSTISALAKGKQWSLALQACAPHLAQPSCSKSTHVFGHMQARGVDADVVTCCSLISALERGGQWHLAQQLFLDMCRAAAAAGSPHAALLLQRMEAAQAAEEQAENGLRRNSGESGNLTPLTPQHSGEAVTSARGLRSSTSSSPENSLTDGDDMSRWLASLTMSAGSAMAPIDERVTASMTSGSSSAFMLADTAMSSDQTAAAAHLMTPSKSAGSLKRAPSLGGPHGSGSPVGSRGSRFDHMAALWPPEAGSSDDSPARTWAGFTPDSVLGGPPKSGFSKRLLWQSSAAGDSPLSCATPANSPASGSMMMPPGGHATSGDDSSFWSVADQPVPPPPAQHRFAATPFELGASPQATPPNPFASQHPPFSGGYSAPQFQPAVTAVPQPSLLPSRSTDSLQEAAPPAGLTIRLRRTLRVAPNRVCCNALLAAYARARHPQWARALVLLGAMWEAGGELAPDTVSYNAALKACGSAGQIATALQVYQAMVQRGVRPSIATFGTIITAASDAGDLDAVQIAWGWLEGSGLEANSTCMNAVVGALARGNAWRPPRGFAGGNGGPGSPTSGYVAGGGAFAGGGLMASRMGGAAVAAAASGGSQQHSSLAAATAMMSNHLHAGQHHKVREVFEEVVGRGLTPNLAIWNTLLASLAAQGAWLDALSALRQMTGGRNAASYRSVLEAISLAATGPGVPSADAAAMAAEGLAVFRAALAAPGPGLDASAFRALAGVLERAGDWQQAVSIFEVMAARGFATDAFVTSATLRACVAAGQTARGAAVLAAACGAVEPDAANGLVAAAAAGGACDTAVQAFNTMRAFQVEVDAPTAAALLRALQDAGHAEAARAVVDALASPIGGRPPPPAVWPVLVVACEAAGDWRRAVELALCMEECGIAPDTHTLNAVVTALRAGAQPDLILSFVQHMKKGRSAAPDALTYRTAVDAMIDGDNFAAAAGLCGDAHTAGTFRHYSIPPLKSEGALTVDLQGCSLQRALVIVVAWLSRAAPLPPDDLPPGRIIIGWNAAEGVQAAVEAFLCCDGGALPAGMAAVLPPRLPPLAFRVEADEGVGPVLALPAVELCAWLPAWAAFSAGGGAGGRGTSALAISAASVPQLGAASQPQ